ncbi:hypothetical protein [Rhizobium sp. BK602]|uniref:hypothetical protein n=1 Tax=Rhizobium sp. BK602 TaxID=2586986 RepID=UPI00161D545B|nr:hypothetical protein [Rhizobium sp. BK602]MBB3609747.1 ABC-type transport system involved in multi-copper enzyme maturation permease subunit [Rhizobium sp. BK602]
MRKIWFVVLAAIILFAFLPVLSVLLAGITAQVSGCQVDEGSVHPCMIAGFDAGELLYSLTVLGWLMLATIPAGLIMLAIWMIAFLVYLWRRRRQGRASRLT